MIQHSKTKKLALVAVPLSMALFVLLAFTWTTSLSEVSLASLAAAKGSSSVVNSTHCQMYRRLVDEYHNLKTRAASETHVAAALDAQSIENAKMSDKLLAHADSLEASGKSGHDQGSSKLKQAEDLQSSAIKLNHTQQAQHFSAEAEKLRAEGHASLADADADFFKVHQLRTKAAQLKQRCKTMDAESSAAKHLASKFTLRVQHVHSKLEPMRDVSQCDAHGDWAPANALATVAGTLVRQNGRNVLISGRRGVALAEAHVNAGQSYLQELRQDDSTVWVLQPLKHQDDSGESIQLYVPRGTSPQQAARVADEVLEGENAGGSERHSGNSLQDDSPARHDELSSMGDTDSLSSNSGRGDELRSRQGTSRPERARLHRARLSSRDAVRTAREDGHISRRMRAAERRQEQQLQRKHKDNEELSMLWRSLRRTNRRVEQGEGKLSVLAERLADANKIIAAARAEEVKAAKQAKYSSVQSMAAKLLTANLKRAHKLLEIDRKRVAKERKQTRLSVQSARGAENSENREATGIQGQAKAAENAQLSAQQEARQAAQLAATVNTDRAAIAQLTQQKARLDADAKTSKENSMKDRLATRKLVHQGRAIAQKALEEVRKSLKGSSAQDATLAATEESKLARQARQDTQNMRQDRLNAKTLLMRAKNDKRNARQIAGRLATLQKQIPAELAQARQARKAARHTTIQARELKATASPGALRLAALKKAASRMDSRKIKAVQALAAAVEKEHAAANAYNSDKKTVDSETERARSSAEFAKTRLKNARARLMAALRVRDESQRRLSTLKKGLDEGSAELKQLRREVKEVAKSHGEHVSSARLHMADERQQNRI